MRPNLFFIVALLLALSQAQAAPRPSPFQCKEDGNQQELNACAVRDYKAADAALKQKVRELMLESTPARQAELRQQQRSWLRKLVPQCRAKAKPSEGGSIWPLEYANCLKEVTERRSRELDRWQAASRP